VCPWLGVLLCGSPFLSLLREVQVGMALHKLHFPTPVVNPLTHDFFFVLVEKIFLSVSTFYDKY
jgi:hypothetical protein